MSNSPSLFICYARQDDEAFVWRLYADLESAGFDAWFDRRNIGTPGLPFSQEIKDAIRSRDRLLYIAGPRAAASDYVREEWLFALAIDKPVVPLLRRGAIENLPDALQRFHCEIFVDDAHYAARLEALIANLRRPLPRPGDLIGVTEKPTHFIERKEVIEPIKGKLLAAIRNPIGALDAPSRVGVHGMAGVGKSVCAVAIARDEEVRRAYPDGIIWLHFGKEPNVVALQRQVARALGGRVDFDDNASGRGVLRHLLRERAVLLVLDDVWRAADVMDLTELPGRSRALLTTRNAGVLRNVGADLASIPLPTLDECRTLLAAATEVDPASLPAEADELIVECGRLPLALALCGGLVPGPLGVPWSTVLEALTSARLEVIRDEQWLNDQHRSLWLALQVSLEMLAEDDRRRWADLTVFPLDRGVPLSVVHTFWEHDGDLGAIERAALSLRLHEMNLIETRLVSDVDAAEPKRLVFMHDLLYDFGVRVSGERPALHRRFADAALNVLQRHPAEFVGYLMDQLPRHLVEARDPARLRDLLTSSTVDYFELWAEQGRAAEGAVALEYLVDELRTSVDSGKLMRLLASQLGRLHNRMGHDKVAKRWLFEALADVPTTGPDRISAVALHELASVALSRGDYATARRGYRTALRIIQRTATRPDGEIAANLIGMAITTYLESLNSGRTSRLARLALVEAERAHDHAHCAEACRILADVSKDGMNYGDAEIFLERGLALAEQARLVTARQSLLAARGWMVYQRVALGEADATDAVNAFRDLQSCAELARDWRFEGEAWSGLGSVAVLVEGSFDLAHARHRLAEICDGEVRPHLNVRLQLLDAAIAMRSGDYESAESMYAQAASASATAQLWSRYVDAVIGRSDALLRLGDVPGAIKYHGEAERALPRCPPARQEIARRKIGVMGLANDRNVVPPIT